jgi:hypothetical protein
MKSMKKIKEMLCEELEVFSKKPNISTADLDKIHKLTDTIKNLDKIEMLEEDDEGGYSEARGRGRGRSSYGMSYDDDMMYSERRGRGRNAKRDSMGRYSRDDGMSYDDYSETYMRGGYSRDDAKDHLMSMLGGMMEDADPNERQILKDAMRKIERA